MKTFYELQEGLYDPNIFKAFFLAGGPGSGKSYVAGRTTGGTGLKSVNSDEAFEYLLKKGWTVSEDATRTTRTKRYCAR